MTTSLRATTIACLAALMMTACSNGGYQGLSSESTAAPGSNSGQDTGGGTTNPIQNVDMKGYIDGGTYEKSQTFDFDKEKGELLISLPLGMDSSIMIGGGSIQQLPGVTFSTTIKADGNYYLVLHVPVRYFLRSVTTLPPGKLPNGQAVPGMPSGEAPTLAFQLNPNSSRKVYLYLGVEAVGVYVESPWLSCFGSPICLSYLSYPIKNQAKTKVLGNFYMFMPSTGKKDGGFFITSIIPPEIARILDDYFL